MVLSVAVPQYWFRKPRVVCGERTSLLALASTYGLSEIIARRNMSMNSREQLNALTGLRFFAAFAIVWLHADLYFGWATSGRGLPLVMGVSFFFVLSGFILSHVYSGRAFSYYSFMKARVARLWPLHAACLLAVILFIRPDSQAFDGPGILSKWVSFPINLLLLQSWVPTTSVMFSWNSVSWSISTEMFFYAMFPLLLPLLKRNAALVLAAGALPIAFLAIAIPALDIPNDGDVFAVTSVPLFYAFPPARLMEFCVGMIAYKAWSRIRISTPTDVVAASLVELVMFGAIAIMYFGANHIAGLFTWSSATSQWYGNAGMCFTFAVLIVAVASSKGVFGIFLGSSLLVRLGEISFAIYMSHQIVMKVIAWTYPEFGNPAFVICAVIFIGAVGHYVVEKPAQRLLMSTRRANIPKAVSA